LDAKILTNDFNLNKVAELQGIMVLNINQLANSVRPNVVAGEELMVKITREGKEHHQGVGYLDDGTMIVVKNGRQYVDEMVDIIVTQTLQTNAGRMIFARLKGDETESDEPEDLRPYSRGWKRKSYGRSSY
ncbi:TPA: TRAM domain-containing protein, partial [Candidatus Poribacteria bacterium]|nr:TRAM domain-containing protein [Candidatus Poribacteria bacterium]